MIKKLSNFKITRIWDTILEKKKLFECTGTLFYQSHKLIYKQAKAANDYYKLNRIHYSIRGKISIGREKQYIRDRLLLV